MSLKRLLIIIIPAFIVLMLFMVGQPTQAGANDNFANRVILSGAGPFTSTSDNISATSEGGEPSCYSAESVWWEFTPTVSATYEINLQGSNYDTALSVFSGNSLVGLSSLGCNDDYYGLQSRLAVSLTAGTAYQIRVSGFCGGCQGNITMNIFQLVSVNMTISDVSMSEGNSGSTNFNFTVSLSSASASWASVNYYTSDGSAVSGSDYQSVSSSVSLAPGQTSATISVPVYGDITVESNENFYVNLYGVSGATLTDSQGVGTIQNDDVMPTISVSNASLTESNGTMVFTVSLNNPTSQNVTFNYATSDGSAANGSDYTATSGSSMISAFSTSTTINVPIGDDAIYEGTETFTLTLSSISNATAGTITGTGSIWDNEGTPTLNIDSPSVGEGAGSGVLNVTLNPASASTVTVNYSFVDGSANSSDYTGTGGTLTFAAGQTAQTISFNVTDDVLSEGNESFTVNLSGASGAALGTSTGTVTITDNEGASGISVADVVVDETFGGGTITVTMLPANAATVTVDYVISPDTATYNVDYSAAASGTLTFAPGSTSATVSFTVMNDTVAEPNETFIFRLSNSSAPTIIDDLAVVTIGNDDALPFTPRIQDGRENAVDLGAPAAIYCVSDGVRVYEIISAANSELVIDATAAEIDAVGIPTDQNVLIEASEDGRSFLYRLTTGEYQAMVSTSTGYYTYIWTECTHGQSDIFGFIQP
jgi:hypothetical protein